MRNKDAAFQRDDCIDKILKGAAKQISVTIPPNVLVRADKVIK